MLKFEKLKKEDKYRRYQTIVKTPTFFILLLLVVYNTNPVITGLVFTTTMIIDLAFHGLVLKKSNYTLKDFSIDACVLYLISILVTLFISPLVSTSLETIWDFTTSSNYLLKIELLCSILIIYITWYGFIFIQNKIANKNTKWKFSIVFFPKGKAI